MKGKDKPKMKELYSSAFHYRSPINVFTNDLQPTEGNFATPGVCHLKVLQGKKQSIVIATEIPTNPGKSVTNAIDQIATLAIEQFHLDPKHTIFIEHYMPQSYEGAGKEETFDLVTFDWQGQEASNPQWKWLQPEQLQALNLPAAKE